LMCLIAKDLYLQLLRQAIFQKLGKLPIIHHLIAKVNQILTRTSLFHIMNPKTQTIQLDTMFLKQPTT
jgi:hypothetical protein